MPDHYFIMANKQNIFHEPRFERISEDKRQKILSIAIEEFAENGFNNTNINVIVEKAGISIGSMYKYFRSKEDLYLTVVNLGLHQLELALNPIMSSKKTFFEKIRLIIDTLFEKTPELKALTRLYNRFTTESNSVLAAKLAGRLEGMAARAYSRLFTQAKREGLVDSKADEKVFAFCMDNIFLIMQFSLSSEYYHDRLKIFLGDDILNRRDFLKKQIYLFIENALTGKHS